MAGKMSSAPLLRIPWLLSLAACGALLSHSAGTPARKPASRKIPGYLQAASYMHQLRSYPSGKVDLSAYDRAAVQQERMPRAQWRVRRGRNQPRQVAAWQPVGPRPVQPSSGRYQGPSKVIGRVNAAAFDPSRAGTLYIASATGGVWKTVDHGQSWRALSDGPEWPFLQTNSIAVDPKRSHTIYVGTGDFVFVGNQNLSHGFGVMKSTDGGSTWRTLGRSRFGNVVVSKVLIDPDRTERITVTTGHGQDQQGNLIEGRVWRSENGGETWSPLIDREAHWNNVVYGAPKSNKVRNAYAVGISEGGELWRSTGGRFQKLKVPRPAPGRVPYYTHLDVATSPTRPETLYLLYIQFSTPAEGGPAASYRRIFKTVNAGKRWADITGTFPHGDTANGNQDNWSQQSYDFCIAASRDRAGRDVVW